MAQPGTPSGGGEFAELPEMTALLCKIASADVELDRPYTDPKTGKVGEAKKQVKVIAEVISYVDDEGDKVEPADAKIWIYTGFSLHEKSKLRPLAAAVFPDMTEAQLFEEFDTDDLVGKKLYVFGEYKPGDKERMYIKAKGYKPYKKGDKAPTAADATAATPAAAETADLEV